ncbi:hypothetical protein Vadar_015990 [Vaccinium darrowii]|uniref:Uncharacterized protein n=1 Tax=Vaccinium darrowii TaxID=229202 RepID=A0ACB7Z4C6_9ERIC|nr:hypothetical protein Vadar_015990 [Vaccinium darrowii]
MPGNGMHWADEDWGSPVPEPLFSGDRTHERFFENAMETKEEKFQLVAKEKGGEKAAAAAGAKIAEVKIKITKKQLKEGLFVEEVVAQLMRAGGDDQRSCRRPALQSIAELN